MEQDGRVEGAVLRPANRSRRPGLAARGAPMNRRQSCRAVEYLRRKLPRAAQRILRRRMRQYGSSWWHHPAGWHFRGGMAVRNLLRKGGFGEKELGVGNLDDVYVELVEQAVWGGPVGGSARAARRRLRVFGQAVFVTGVLISTTRRLRGWLGRRLRWLRAENG